MAEPSIWLPLLEDLSNQGLASISVANNGATISSDGKIGSCYTFDGTDDYMLVDSVDGSASEITFCCWFSPLSGFTSAHLMDARASSGVGYQPMYVTASSIQVGGSSTAYPYFYTTFTAGEWYHIAVVYSSFACTLYVNGAAIGESTQSMAYAYNQDLPLTIASRYNNSSHLKCSINDVRVYYSALSAKEVREIAQGLVLHFPLDNNALGTSEAMMATVYDCSGYHHDGTCIDAPVAQTATARHVSSTYLDGINDGISIMGVNLNPVINGSHTICFWIKSESGSTAPASVDYSGIAPYSESSVGSGLKLYWEGEAGDWHHVAVVCSGLTSVSSYYDGELRQSATVSRTPTTFSNNWRIGLGASLSDEDPYNGLISDFRIYATALLADDIKYLYEVGASVDNKQNFHTYDYVEEGETTAKILKTGATKSTEFTEAEAAAIYDDGDISALHFIEL